MNANTTIRAYIKHLASQVPPRRIEIASVLEDVAKYGLDPDNDDLRTLGGCIMSGRAPLRFVCPVNTNSSFGE